MTLEGLEIRVEVVSIMEIASSAFSLNQTRMAREERMKAGDLNDEEGEGDIEVEGEGPMPKYSRGMLKFQLTDGTTVLPAIEYRPLPDLSLENAPLGYKVVYFGESNNVCRPNLHALLSIDAPKEHINSSRGCISRTKMRNFVGSQDRGTRRKSPCRFYKGTTFPYGVNYHIFVLTEISYSWASLRHRLPEHEPAPARDDTDSANTRQSALNNQTRQAQSSVLEFRSPLRDISPPPPPPLIHSMNDDEELEPRRRRVPHRKTNAIPSQGPSTAKSDTTSISPYFSMTGAPKVGAQSRAKQLDNGLGTTDIDLLLSPKRREVHRPFLITSPPPLAGPEDEGFWANDNGGPANGDNTKEASGKQAEQGKGKGKEKPTSYSAEDLDDFEDDSMDFDPKFLEGLDTIEKEAYNRMTAPPPSSALPSTSGSSNNSTMALPSTGKSTIQAIEVITIEDDEDGDAEDKENVPVPTRHVRRRTGDDGSGGLGTRVLSGSQRSRDPGRPTILAKTASAVIDLSDSD